MTAPNTTPTADTTLTLPFGYDGASFTIQVYRRFSEHGEDFVEGRVLSVSGSPDGVVVGMVAVWQEEPTSK